MHISVATQILHDKLQDFIAHITPPIWNVKCILNISKTDKNAKTFWSVYECLFADNFIFNKHFRKK